MPQPDPTPLSADRRSLAGPRAPERTEDDPIARFFDVALDLLAVASVETGRFVRVGSGFTRLLGWAEADLAGTPFLELVHPDDLDVSLAAVAALAGGDDLVEFENRALCKDGSARWIDWQIAPDPEAGLIYAAGRDVTERHQREANTSVLAGLAADTARASTEGDILRALTTRLRERLDASAVLVADLDGEARVAAVHGDDVGGLDAATAPHPLPSVLRGALAEGVGLDDPVVVRVPPSDPSPVWLEGRSFIAVPSLRDGLLRHVLIVAADGARDWRLDEVDLVAEAAARVIPRLERARAEAEVRALNRALEARIVERTADVRRLSRALVEAEQAERDRIARVLHDDLQQVLFGALIKTQTGEAEGAEALVRRAASITRTLSHELAPPVLYEGELSDLLDWLAEHAQDLHGLDVTVRTQGGVKVAAPHVRIVLYVALNELLLNVAKHAGAARVRISAEAAPAPGSEPGVQVTVDDDGVGFDQPAVPGGVGLSGSRDRLELVGGTLDVESSPGAGTRVILVVPSGASPA